MNSIPMCLSLVQLDIQKTHGIYELLAMRQPEGSAIIIYGGPNVSAES